MDIKIIKKNVKHINIILTAPFRTTEKHISYVLEKRNDWIHKKIKYYKKNQPPPAKEYVSGENFDYLGKKYRLKVIQRESEDVKFQRGYLYLYVKDKGNTDRKKNLIKAWYYSKANIHYQKALIILSLIGWIFNGGFSPPSKDLGIQICGRWILIFSK